MKGKVCCIIILLCCAALNMFAQGNNIDKLLNAYDYLFFNRTNNNYTDSSKRYMFFTKAQKTVRGIDNDTVLKEKYSMLYNRYYAEYYYLECLVYLDKNKNQSTTHLLLFLDSAIDWFSKNLEVKADSAALNSLQKAAGIRAESVVLSNSDLYYSLIDNYNLILLTILQQQWNDYNKSEQYNFTTIDNTFKLHKFHTTYQQDDYDRDTIFQSMLMIYAYFRVMEEAKTQHCDSLLYYYTLYKVLTAT